MCGIVGMLGNTEAAPIILDALKKLEYRGYDSAGMATCVDGCIEIRKGVGKLDEVEKNNELSRLPGTVGIGHVRWATHGGVTVENAHPHFDCSQQVAIVHNGIIENYQELRQCCGLRHKFTSETDTEVIVHLIEEQLQQGLPLERAVYNVTKQLKGSYALLVISCSEPDKIVAARKDSPLLIGIGENVKLLASDILCFLARADRSIIMEDGDIAVLTRNEICIFDSEYRQINRESVRFDMKAEEATKKSHPYFMLKEILEQPQSIRQALQQDKKIIMDAAINMLRARHIVFTACGTSRHAALVGRYAFSKLTGIMSEVVLGSEFQYFLDSVDKNTTVIAISQSGETADVIQGVRKAKENGAKVFSVVNTRGSTLARLSDWTIYLQCGPEIAVAATKSFISQLSIFYLLSFAMINRLDEGTEKLLPLTQLIEDDFKYNHTGIVELANTLKDKRDFYFIGRGINYAIAGEGALKLKEIAYVHAEGMSAGELKHGTLALIEPGTPVVALCPRDYTFDETLSNVMETKARGAFVIGVSNKPNEAFDAWIHIPDVEEIFYPLVCVIPLQLLAYHSAIARGYDPDKPRILAKCVTVK